MALAIDCLLLGAVLGLWFNVLVLLPVGLFATTDHRNRGMDAYLGS